MAEDNKKLVETPTPKETPKETPTPKSTEIKPPTTEEREDEHSELKKLVSQYESIGERIDTPITVDKEQLKINPLDSTQDIKQNEMDEQTEFNWTKHFLDQQMFSANTALRTNSIATLGSQVKINYEVYMPEQQKLQEEQKQYTYLNQQLNQQQKLARIALQQQQAQGIAATQQLAQRLNLEVGQSRQNMESSITTMLNVYNQYQSSINNLVLSKDNIANQQKIIDAKKQSSHKSWWSGLMQTLPVVLMAGFAGGKLLGGIGKIGGLAEGLAEKAVVAEGETMSFGQGLAKAGAAALSGGGWSKSIAGLIGGATSLGMYLGS